MGFFSKPGDIGNKAKRETLAERVTYFAAQLINVICGWFRFHDFTAENLLHIFQRYHRRWLNAAHCN